MSSEWTADQLRAGAALAKELGFQLISNQPQYSALWRVIEEEVVPTSKELGISQIVWSPDRPGRAHRQVQAGQPLPEGSRATDDKGGADMIKRFMRDEVLSSVQELEPIAKELDLSMAQLAVAWVLQNENVASAIIGASRPEQVHDNAGAAGVDDPGRAAVPHRRRPRWRRRARPGEDERQQPEDPRGLSPAQNHETDTAPRTTTVRCPFTRFRADHPGNGEGPSLARGALPVAGHGIDPWTFRFSVERSTN